MLELTCDTVSDAIRRDACRTGRLLVCGGFNNRALMRRLDDLLAVPGPVTCRRSPVRSVRASSARCTRPEGHSQLYRSTRYRGGSVLAQEGLQMGLDTTRQRVKVVAPLE
jgi:1,6-anhydro-N-acetylmuramate kinase